MSDTMRSFCGIHVRRSHVVYLSSYIHSNFPLGHFTISASNTQLHFRGSIRIIGSSKEWTSVGGVGGVG